MRLIYLTSCAFVLLQIMFATSVMAEQPDPWAPLQLKTFEAHGVSIRYEPAFEGQQEHMANASKEMLVLETQVREQIDWLRTHRDQIIISLNEILNHKPNPNQYRLQQQVVDDLARTFATVIKHKDQRMGVIVASKLRIKDLLKSGASLPSFTCHFDTKTISFNPKPYTDVNDSGTAWFVLPVADEQDMAKSMTMAISPLNDSFLKASVSGSLHELIEMTMFSQVLKTQTVHFRWLSEGFSNLIAFELMRKFGKTKEAKISHGTLSLEPYKGLKSQLNLQYWLGANVEIQNDLKSENRLTLARYAYTTHFAQGLVDRHGLKVIGKILAKAQAMPSDQMDLIQAASDVTGEDIAKQLAEFQQYSTHQQLRVFYVSLFDKALAQNNHQLMLRCVIRLSEVNAAMNPRDYVIAALMQYRMQNKTQAMKLMHQAHSFYHSKNDRKLLENFVAAINVYTKMFEQPDFLKQVKVELGETE